jgi:hypothetical protein
LESLNTPRARYLKLMEDALHSRVNGAQEALLVAKLNFRRTCLQAASDPEFQRELEIGAARAQTRALENLLTAVMEFNAFIQDEDVPKDAPLYGNAVDTPTPKCSVCGLRTHLRFGDKVLCMKCDNRPLVASRQTGPRENGAR